MWNLINLKTLLRMKTYSSRLTTWIDRLIPFNMELVHQPGRTTGLADYLSRHPSDYNENE